MPIHLRYHRAKSGNLGDLHSTVDISHPNIYLLCELEEHSQCILYTQLEPCPPTGHLNCDWLPINSFSVSTFCNVKI